MVKWEGCVTASRGVAQPPPQWEVLVGTGLWCRGSWIWRLEERSDGELDMSVWEPWSYKDLLLLQPTLVRPVEFAQAHWQHGGPFLHGENPGLGKVERFPWGPVWAGLEPFRQAWCLLCTSCYPFRGLDSPRVQRTTGNHHNLHPLPTSAQCFAQIRKTVGLKEMGWNEFCSWGENRRRSEWCFFVWKTIFSYVL